MGRARFYAAHVFPRLAALPAELREVAMLGVLVDLAALAADARVERITHVSTARVPVCKFVLRRPAGKRASAGGLRIKK